MTIQFIPEVSVGNAMVLLGVIIVFFVAYLFFGYKVRAIETNVRRVEDIIEHRDFKQAVIDALEEVRHIQHVTQVDSIGRAKEVHEVDKIHEAKEVEKLAVIKTATVLPKGP